ncbi:hypothetical protein L6R50_07225 [Myxococcota bacterium]|nr:hypothetical protein [Myxococcota bacterium]
MSAEHPGPPLHFVAELHVDDLRLARRPWPRRYRATEDLVREIAERARARGVPLSVRFREHFARATALYRGAGANLLRDLEAGGHEVGTHAHGRRLLAARFWIDRCGVERNDVAVPGLIRKGSLGTALGLWKARGLGFRYVTDRLERPDYTHRGFVPFRPSPLGLRPTPGGPVACADPSLEPWEWGVLSVEGEAEGTPPWGAGHRGRVLHASPLTDGEWDRLLAALHAQLHRPRPGPVAYFSFAFHEHNLCGDQDPLAPAPGALDAWERFLARAQDLARAGRIRPVTSAGLFEAWERSAPAEPPPAEGGSAAPRPHPPRRRPGGPSRPRALTLDSGFRKMPARLHAPRTSPRAVLVVSVAGRRGGTEVGLAPFGLGGPSPLVDAGIAVLLYDRAGTALHPLPGPLRPGRPEHEDDIRAALRAGFRVAGGAPVGLLTFSGAAVAASAVLAEDDTPPVSFWADAEGPADRFDLCLAIPGTGAWLGRGHPTGEACALQEFGRSLLDAGAWEELEPLPRMARVRTPYLRIQAEEDHVHRRYHGAALRMLQAAARGPSPTWRCNDGPPDRPSPREADLDLLPGRLVDRGDRVLASLLAALARAGAL